jgi:hypothetical protein
MFFYFINISSLGPGRCSKIVERVDNTYVPSNLDSNKSSPLYECRSNPVPRNLVNFQNVNFNHPYSLSWIHNLMVPRDTCFLLVLLKKTIPRITYPFLSLRKSSISLQSYCILSPVLRGNSYSLTWKSEINSPLHLIIY